MKLTLLILVSLFSASASAAIYKCTDTNGNTKYRSNPCETGPDNGKINIKTGASTTDNKNNHQDLAQKEQQMALEKQKLEQLLKKQANIN